MGIVLIIEYPVIFYIIILAYIILVRAGVALAAQAKLLTYTGGYHT